MLLRSELLTGCTGRTPLLRMLTVSVLRIRITVLTVLTVPVRIAVVRTLTALLLRGTLFMLRIVNGCRLFPDMMVRLRTENCR